MSDRSRSGERDNITLIGGYVAAIINAAVARGADRAALLGAAGLDGVPTTDPLIRIPVGSFRRLLDAAVAATRDPYFGLYAADFVHPSSLHAIGLSLLASSDLNELCIRLCRCFRFLAGTTQPTFVVDGDDARLEFHHMAPALEASQDTFGVFLVRMIRQLSDGAVTPTLVELQRSIPDDGGERHARAFGCQVNFHRETTIIHFDSATVALRFEGGSRELAEHNERIVVRYLAQLDRSDVESRVRAILMQDLPTGAVTKERVAGKLAMSPRTLQIKLANHGTSFQAVVDSTRYALACGHMDNASISITEVAYLLGFSDTSNFSRAFRRWSGRSPSQYRTAVHERTNGASANGNAALPGD